MLFVVRVCTFGIVLSTSCWNTWMKVLWRAYFHFLLFYLALLSPEPNPGQSASLYCLATRYLPHWTKTRRNHPSRLSFPNPFSCRTSSPRIFCFTAAAWWNSQISALAKWTWVGPEDRLNDRWMQNIRGNVEIHESRTFVIWGIHVMMEGSWHLDVDVITGPWRWWSWKLRWGTIRCK